MAFVRGSLPRLRSRRKRSRSGRRYARRGRGSPVAVNRDKPDRWKGDVGKSVDLYNDWFMKFAPRAFRDTRVRTTKKVQDTFKQTEDLRDIRIETLRREPGILPTLRMVTCPPLARDRLIGLAGVSKSLVERMEKEGKLAVSLPRAELDGQLNRIGDIIQRMVDPDIFPWLKTRKAPDSGEAHRAATIVADRLCGATADPIIRNAQEKRQLGGVGQ